MSSPSRSKNDDSTSYYLGEKKDSDGNKGSSSSNGREKQHRSTADYMVRSEDPKLRNGSRSSSYASTGNNP